MELNRSESNDHEDPTSLTRSYNVIKKFNRNTTWVATGLLGSVFFAALMVALQDRRVKSDEPSVEESQSAGELTPTFNAAVFTNSTSRNDKQIDEVVSEQPTSLNSGVVPVINQLGVKPDAPAQTQVSDKDSARATNERIRHVSPRSSVRSKYVGVKARLIALWHQSTQRKKSPGWTLSTNSKEDRKKKVSYTTATNQ
jgi:hypothetical protein